MSELGVFIKEKRALREFSIRKLAELAGISHTEVKRIEDGVRKQPSPQVLRAIAEALNVPYDDIMTAAGYIDTPANMIVAAKIKDADDLTDEEILKVEDYINYIKSQRK
ncbi:HTH-type transcriptional repressor RghR [bioreactor metagenome]|uniref:HTH-type transcriptional repressor RghR n=1 Tax=bioreactor metagenome TaxID=1076179 RepID=A0A645B9F5_9ZZZZ